MRLAKRIAQLFPFSRRQAERLIIEERVSVNGQKISTPAYLVSCNDLIQVDQHQAPENEHPRLYCYHKPAGCLVTCDDPFGRPTIFQRMNSPIPVQRLLYVGRLDQDSEGLLMLTNAPAVAHQLQQPGLLRTYNVLIFGPVPEKFLMPLTRPMEVEGWHYPGCHLQKISRYKGDTWVTLSLNEGKKREIRQRFKALGLPIKRLIRTEYGPFKLGLLQTRDWKEVSVDKMVN